MAILETSLKVYSIKLSLIITKIICRVRHGYAHVANNIYQEWEQYAIGGSMSPSIKSEANLFVAPKSGNKEVSS